MPKIQIGGALFGADHKVGGDGELPPIQAKEFSNQAFYPVSFDRRAHMLPNRDPQSPVGEAVGAQANAKMVRLQFRPISGDSQEIGPATDPLLFSESIKSHLPGVPVWRDGLTQYWLASTTSLFRPLALLRCKTKRPPFVDMRFKKPWVLFLRILLGWYVLFTDPLLVLSNDLVYQKMDVQSILGINHYTTLFGQPWQAQNWAAQNWASNTIKSFPFSDNFRYKNLLCPQ